MNSNVVKTNSKTILNVEDLATGVYVVRAYTGEATLTQKLVIE